LPLSASIGDPFEMKKPLEVLRLYPEHDYTLNGAFESRARRDKNRNYESRSNA
jgi:hypothetical protein